MEKQMEFEFRKEAILMNPIDKAVRSIMDKIQAHKLDALDGDQTQELAEYFRIELDWNNGNITADERKGLLAKMAKG